MVEMVRNIARIGEARSIDWRGSVELGLVAVRKNNDIRREEKD